jgi:hypothetical protein
MALLEHRMLSYEPALTAASALFLSMNIIKKG